MYGNTMIDYILKVTHDEYGTLNYPREENNLRGDSNMYP